MTKILISIRPEWVAKILNKEKTVEIRKSFPKCELPCEVYIYCTKSYPNVYIPFEYLAFEEDETSKPYLANNPILDIDDQANGKVVAKFILKMVDEADVVQARSFSLDSDVKDDLVMCMFRNTGLTWQQIYEYCKDRKKVYCWYIDDLEIFEHPKTLQDYGLTKAPQSWCYIKKGNK